MMKKYTPIVIITIGEAPRQDIADTYDDYFSLDEMVSQIGLLDQLTPEEAHKQLGATHLEATLVSTYRSGQFIKMSHAKVEIALQSKIDQLERQGVKLIVIFCTAEFKSLKTKTARLVEPEKVILPLIKRRFGGQRIGVMVPLPEQQAEIHTKWQTISSDLAVVAASPYEFDKHIFKTAVEKLNHQGVDLIILDCMGYNRKMKTFLGQLTERQIYQSNELLFDYLLEVKKEL